jgi:uncharacterized protein (TIGR02001 family)
MKRILLSLITAVVPAGWAGAAMPQDISVSSDITYSSRYVFRGIQLAGNSFQPALEVGMGDLYAGVWANLPTASGGTEIDYYAGTAIAVPWVEFLSLDVGLTVYHYPKSGDSRTHEFYLGALFPQLGLPGLSGSIYYFHDIDIRSQVLEGALTHSLSLEGWGLPASLDLSVHASTHGGSRVKSENYHYYGASLELPFYLNDYSTITPGVHYATAEKYTFGEGERGKNLFWSISYAASF